MDYLAPPRSSVNENFVVLEGTVTRETFITMTPRQCGLQVDRMFARMISDLGFIQGPLLNYEIRPYVLGLGYVQDWTRWDGFRVFGSYSYTKN